MAICRWLRLSMAIGRSTYWSNENMDLRRHRSHVIDVPDHNYEPGGRRFESCWATIFLRKIEHVAPRSTLSFAKTGATLLPLTLATSLELIAEMIAMVGRRDGGIPRSGGATNFVWEKFGFAV